MLYFGEMVDKPRTELAEGQFERIARALAEPRRVQILRQLGACAGSTPCANLLDVQEISPATMSHHLKELEAAGLILHERDGKFVKLTLVREVLQSYLQQMADITQ